MVEKPRPPGKRASSAEWDRYHTDMAAWRTEQRGPRHVQHRGPDAVVKVQSGYSADKDCPTSDFIIADPGDPTGHLHLVLDEWGNPIYDGWNENH